MDPTKGLRTPREFDFGGQWDLITELSQDWGNRLLEAQQNFVQGRTQEKGAVTPQETEQEACMSLEGVGQGH